MASKKHSDETGSGSGSIPVLSEVVSLRRPTAHLAPDKIAALQTELVAQTLKTAEELLHAAARDIEATLLERVADQLRARLPEIVDRVLKEQLARAGGPRSR
ncbi:MAG: hypothetical protein ACRET4_14665 [Steroidobacteraceae bacterium]